MATQPTFTWTASSGTISHGGAFHRARHQRDTCTVTAKSGALRAGDGRDHRGSNALGLVDPRWQTWSQSLDADGSISRLDMMQILRSVAANGAHSAPRI